MAIVITFAKHFPAYHFRRGEQTHFPSKVVFNEKKHTIRVHKHRWAPGELFSPRYWTGKPYRSKQNILGQDLEVKKVWDITIIPRVKGNVVGGVVFPPKIYISNVNPPQQINETIPVWELDVHGHYALALNDGLSTPDFYAWFPKQISGQIICWDESVDYDNYTLQSKHYDYITGKTSLDIIQTLTKDVSK